MYGRSPEQRQFHFPPIMERSKREVSTALPAAIVFLKAVRLAVIMTSNVFSQLIDSEIAPAASSR